MQEIGETQDGGGVGGGEVKMMPKQRELAFLAEGEGIKAIDCFGGPNLGF